MVAKRMYSKRFGEVPRSNELDSLRGMEAARIKTAYEVIASQIGIPWRGRRYDRNAPDKADVPNQAINHAVTALEACVAIAVQATATIPSLGFLHETSSKSFILDICDLFRTTVTVPIAFRCAKKASAGEPLDRVVRGALSRYVRETGFIDIVIDDIKELLV
jgi:CRISPR-associated protein Cas1